MDRLVTLFGGGGFLGRYVAQELLKAGVRLRIAERDPKNAWFLKPLGGLGQTQFVSVDVRDAEGAKRAASGSHAVVNLVGILKGDFRGFHVDGARNAAEAAAAAGAESFVQVSAIGADADAESAYGATKGEGEKVARAAFPAATIIRPSIVFGPEDAFLNRFATMARLPVLPVVRGATKFQPVHVADVARAIAAAAIDPKAHAGRTYELGGPQVITMKALLTWIAETIGSQPIIADIPDPVASAMARLGGWAPGAPITWDQWLMLQRDNVVGPAAVGFEAFDIAPTPLAAVAPGWLVRFQKHGRFTKQKAA